MSLRTLDNIILIQTKYLNYYSLNRLFINTNQQDYIKLPRKSS